jgi:predicted house-cleaning noncanonical NTP pyrophosphatase (MazG superfamily)
MSNPSMQRVVVNRFRRRSDAEECVRTLRRSVPDGDYTVVYYPPSEETLPMIRKTHNKLVRDRIPQILESQSIQFAVEGMTPDQYRQALRQKLLEEAQEAATATEANLITELADLWEVIDATISAHGIRRDHVLACQLQRRMARGTFDRRLKLLWTEH